MELNEAVRDNKKIMVRIINKSFQPQRKRAKRSENIENVSKLN